MTTKTSKVQPASTISPLAAQLAAFGGLTFIVLLALLHLLKPDLDPNWRAISEYALGDYGWLMTIAFFAWGLGAVSLFFALRKQVSTIPGRIGLALLLLAALGPILAGIFPTDPITVKPEEATTAGMFHAVGATLGDFFAIAATVLTVSLLRKNPNWSAQRWPLIWVTVAAWVGFWTVSIGLAIYLPQNNGLLGPNVPVGWENRFMVAAYAGVVAVFGWCALRVRNKRA